jgi:hypothetical protein
MAMIKVTNATMSVVDQAMLGKVAFNEGNFKFCDIELSKPIGARETEQQLEYIVPDTILDSVHLRKAALVAATAWFRCAWR